jgi:hypothetical protein
VAIAAAVATVVVGSYLDSSLGKGFHFVKHGYRLKKKISHRRCHSKFQLEELSE